LPPPLSPVPSLPFLCAPPLRAPPLRPPPLERGDRIAIVAPSSPFDRTLAYRGLAWLSRRYRLVYRKDIFARDGYLAGSDDRRLGELNEAFRSGARAILAVRGGYGLSRIAHAADWRLLAERPTWIVGFSDVTALHVEASRLGLPSIHGPMVCGLGRGDAHARDRWIDALERPFASRAWSGLTPRRAGCAEGPLFGGNLALLHACAAANRLRVPEGAVLLLEDVSERPYRVDRMLTTLAVGGHFANVSAILLGDFTACDPGPDRTRIEDVLSERLERLGVPVLAGAPVGHGVRNFPVTLGAKVRVDGARGTCTFGPP
jgi:muramoyltetrapeptide carboxypeptidase